MYRSPDSETDWNPVNSGIKVDFGPDPYPAYGQCVHRIAMDAVDSDRLYAQSHGGVFRSENGGQTWEPIMASLPGDFGFVVLAHPPRAKVAWVDRDGTAAIAFGTRNGSVFVILGEGETFSEVASRLPDVLSVRISD